MMAARYPCGLRLRTYRRAGWGSFAAVLSLILVASPTTAMASGHAHFVAPYAGGNVLASATNSSCGAGTASSSASANLTRGQVNESVAGNASSGGSCGKAFASGGIGVTFTANRSTDSTTPPPRAGAMMAYDAKDGYVVMFGGRANSFPAKPLADTWKFSRGVWTNLTSSIHPPATSWGSMVYDASDGYVLLYDGACARSCDTWSFSGGVWKVIPNSHSPPHRTRAALGYDPRDGYAVLFGGSYNPCACYYLNDTWKFHHGVWTQLHPGVAPSVRADDTEGGLVYDAKDGYLVLFGGTDVGSGGNSFYFNDTWSFSNGSWQQLAPSAAPAPRADAAMSYDPGIPAVVLFGGIVIGPQGQMQVFRDTWRFSGGQWTSVPASAAPPYGNAPSSVFDPGKLRVVLFGGAAGMGSGVVVSGPFSSQTWLFDRAGWTQELFPGIVRANWTLRWNASSQPHYYRFCVGFNCRSWASSASVTAQVRLTITDVTPNATQTPSFGASTTFLDLRYGGSSSSPPGGLNVSTVAGGQLTRNHTYRIDATVTVWLSVRGLTFTFLRIVHHLAAGAFFQLSAPSGGTLDRIRIQ